MSSLPITGARPQRVRHQARQSLAVMAMSVGLSAGFATLLLLLTRLGR